tara:strand:+ start:7655 stop:9028 length:1374 start_codon:yes stop_codon:yes gene_type:complete
MYAIVDLETTGGSATKSRITEVAIVKHDGNQIVEEFQTLINPQREIPPQIVRLTGITDEMVIDAPTFSQVADQIEKLTQDCIFVAHNVNFDYSFLRAAFQQNGQSFKRKKLCTVRLSRKLLPGKASYSLGKLCKSEEIPLQNRHRAMGDAKATALLFEKLLKIDTEGFIQKALNPLSLEALLPPNLAKADFNALPEEQGLYYMKDKQGKIVYIGQAKNIKKRVHSHFSGNSNTRSKYHFVKNIYSLDFKLIPSKLILDISEAAEIKKHWPRYNSSLKRFSLNYGLFLFEDRKGYQRLNIGKCGKFDKPIHAFRNQHEAHEFVENLVINHQLCPRLCGLQPLGSGKCNYFKPVDCKGACTSEEEAKSYNQRINKALDLEIKENSTYLVRDEVSMNHESAIVLIENGRFKGYGTIPKQETSLNLEQIKSRITAAYDDQDMANLVHAFLSNHEAEISYFS